MILNVSLGDFLVTMRTDAPVQAQVLFPDVPLAVLSLREGASTEGAGVAQPVTRHVARQS